MNQDIRKYPCCMCPAVHKRFETKCPDCGFVKTFTDEREWVYFVRQGLGDSNYKVFYRKPGSRKEKGCTIFQWKKSFMEAQEELNTVAIQRGWKALPNKEPKRKKVSIGGQTYLIIGDECEAAASELSKEKLPIFESTIGKIHMEYMVKIVLENADTEAS